MSNLPRDLLASWDVVVIDDEEDSLEVAEIILMEYGANVYVAYDGQEGLELVQKIKPRFVISDLSMPVLDGWGFIKYLRQDPELANIPVIALTAHAMVGDREKTVEAGFDNYMTKPLIVKTFMSDLIQLLVDIPVLTNDLNI